MPRAAAIPCNELKVSKALKCLLKEPPDPPLADQFHAHLDRCARCAREPFSLCSIGHLLLLAAAGEIGEAVHD